MKIKLIKKADSTHTDPLVIQYVEGEDGGPQKKITKKVCFGEEIEVDDQTGYGILSKYKGMFEQVTSAPVQVEEKSKKEYANKSAKSAETK